MSDRIEGNRAGTYHGAVCKGSYALGTACGKCERCLNHDPMRPRKPMEMHEVLKEVPSGKIELVDNGVYSTLQFNCHCLDALPFCKAMCCRLRQGFTVMMTPNDDASKYKTKPHPQNPELKILQHDADGKQCTYLSDKFECTIHTDSPWMCGAYHCSPGGKGDRVQYRDGGWIWSPMGLVQQLGDGSVVDMRNAARSYK
jgi:hypothetical protein